MAISIQPQLRQKVHSFSVLFKRQTGNSLLSKNFLLFFLVSNALTYINTKRTDLNKSFAKGCQGYVEELLSQKRVWSL